MLKHRGALLTALLLIAGSDALAASSTLQPQQVQQLHAAGGNAHVHAPEPFWKQTATDPVAAFTFVLAAFTGVLTVATIFLWWETKRSGERQDRAYVSGTPHFIYSFDENRAPRSRWTIKNHGSTPARNLTIQAAITLAPFPFQSGFSLPSLEGVSASAPSSLFPQAESVGNTIGPDKFSKAQIADIVAGISVICVYGEIVYRDAFSKRRWTRFCYYVEPNSETLEKLTRNYIPSDLQVSFTIAPMGNDYK